MGYTIINHYPPSTLVKMAELAALLFCEEFVFENVTTEIDIQKEVITVIGKNGSKTFTFASLIG